MHVKIKDYLALTGWILVFLSVGALIGSLTKTDVHTWYGTINRSPLTPPPFVFGIAWSILYAIIATCGWLIWRAAPFPGLQAVKRLYIGQLLLNWSWMPVFFHYRLIGVALVSLLIMDVAVGLIVYRTYSNLRAVALLMLPYWGWIVFATYLNGYIWMNNSFL